MLFLAQGLEPLPTDGEWTSWVQWGLGLLLTLLVFYQRWRVATEKGKKELVMDAIQSLRQHTDPAAKEAAEKVVNEINKKKGTSTEVALRKDVTRRYEKPD